MGKSVPICSSSVSDLVVSRYPLSLESMDLLTSVVDSIRGRLNKKGFQNQVLRADKDFPITLVYRLHPRRELPFKVSSLTMQDTSAISGTGKDSFVLDYDYLVVSVGAETNTFGTPGVKEHAYFLKVRDYGPAQNMGLGDRLSKCAGLRPSGFA